MAVGELHLLFSEQQTRCVGVESRSRIILASLGGCGRGGRRVTLFSECARVRMEVARLQTVRKLIGRGHFCGKRSDFRATSQTLNFFGRIQTAEDQYM